MEINKNNLGHWAISEELFDWIIDNIPQGSTILELGSGSGSHELGKMYNVHCIEHNKEWVNKFPNITYHYAPLKDGWYDPEWLGNLPKEYALLLVDGPPGYIGRTPILNHLDLFNLETVIVVDDSNRDVEKKLAESIMGIVGRQGIYVYGGKESCIIK